MKDIRKFAFLMSLKSLSLKCHFNHEVKDANLPEGLIYLELKGRFNQDIKDTNFPESLRRLILHQ